MRDEAALDRPLLALAALAASEGTALGAAGDLDPTFGSAGRQLLDASGAVVDTLVQPDGKVVLMLDDGSGDFVVRRLNAADLPTPSSATTA